MRQEKRERTSSVMLVAGRKVQISCDRPARTRKAARGAARSFERILLDARLRAVSSVKCCEKRLHLFMARGGLSGPVTDV